MMPDVRATVALATAVWMFAQASSAIAQDFSASAVPFNAATLSGALENGLPSASPSARLESAVTRWDGVAGLDTRAAVFGCGLGAMRAVLGVSQTGEPDIGWSAFGASLGAVTRGGAAALRAVTRRDRATVAGGRAGGVEIGAGAWAEAGAGVRVWASAPQLWTDGAAPPLARGLEIGASADLGGVALWLSRAAVVGLAHEGRGEHTGGLLATAGPLALWLVARDQPARGGIGVAARRRGLGAGAEVIGHPVLGETARMWISLGGGP
jgi:hypothetical protein